MRQDQRERVRPISSAEGLRSALRAAGLSRLLELPGWAPWESIGLLPAAESARAGLPVGTSKFGGYPDLPARRAWPLAPDGSTLSFLAQIKLADITGFPAARSLPGGGWLWFFAETLLRPGKQPTCAVLHEPASDAELMTVAAPGDAHGTPACDSFTERKIEFQNLLGLPELPPAGLRTDEKEAYWELVDVDAIVHKLLGEPNRIQQPVRRPARGGSRPDLLLQLDTDQRLDMQWGDNGRLFVLVPETGLRRADFSACRAVIQSH